MVLKYICCSIQDNDNMKKGYDKMAKQKNVIRMFRRPSSNIGLFIFAIILLYLVITVIIYATRKKTMIYEVSDGALSVDNTYVGLAVRNETVIKSSYAGSVNYFFKNKHMAGKQSLVCSVDESKRVAELINQNTSKTFKEQDLMELRDRFIKLCSEYNNNRFFDTYNLIDISKSSLFEMQASGVADKLDSYIESTDSEKFFHKVYVDNTGIVVYNVDGFENFNESELNDTMFDYESYQNDSLTNNSIVNQGDALFKVITDEYWNIYIKLDSSETDRYIDYENIIVTFPDYDITTKAGIEIIRNGSGNYAKLSLNKYMVNFADQRYIHVELAKNSPTGLKIPNSAICTRNSYSIPKEYFTSAKTFIMKKYNEKGAVELTPVKPHIYYADKDNYYVSLNDFSSGDLLLKSDSDETFVVGIIQELEGVYCVNKGYTEFKAVTVLDKNDEYSIVKSKTEYGLVKYDYIVLDHTTVKDSEILY